MMWISAGAAPEEADTELAALAKSYGKAACVRALDILLRKEYEMRQNLRADIVLETAVMALMAPEDDDTAPDAARVEKLEARLAALEKRAAEAPIAPAATASVKPAETATQKAARTAGTEKAQPAKAAAPPRDASADAIWRQALDKLKADAYFIYTQANKAAGATLAGDRLELLFDGNDVAAEFLRGDSERKAVESVVAAAAGRPIIVTVTVKKRDTGAGTGPASRFTDNIEEI
jgi:DNA polymerase III gamma/tau subunit